jgi:hypothetical protein
MVFLTAVEKIGPGAGRAGSPPSFDDVQAGPM